MLTIGKIDIARPARVSLSGNGLADVQLRAEVASDDFVIAANWIAKDISTDVLTAVHELGLAVEAEAAKHGTPQGVFRIVLTENADNTGHVFFGKARVDDKTQWFRFDPRQLPAVADPVATVVSEVHNAAAGLVIEALPGDPQQTK
jgi:pyridoxine/pyridoxamine 5'-phosphate oxidase